MARKSRKEQHWKKKSPADLYQVAPDMVIPLEGRRRSENVQMGLDDWATIQANRVKYGLWKAAYEARRALGDVPQNDLAVSARNYVDSLRSNALPKTGISAIDSIITASSPAGNYVDSSTGPIAKPRETVMPAEGITFRSDLDRVTERQPQVAGIRNQLITQSLRGILHEAAVRSGEGYTVDVTSGAQMTRKEAIAQGYSPVTVGGQTRYRKIVDGVVDDVTVGSKRHGTVDTGPESAYDKALDAYESDPTEENLNALKAAGSLDPGADVSPIGAADFNLKKDGVIVTDLTSDEAKLFLENLSVVGAEQGYKISGGMGYMNDPSKIHADASGTPVYADVDGVMADALRAGYENTDPITTSPRSKETMLAGLEGATETQLAGIDDFDAEVANLGGQTFSPETQVATTFTPSVDATTGLVNPSRGNVIGTGGDPDALNVPIGGTGPGAAQTPTTTAELTEAQKQALDAAQWGVGVSPGTEGAYETAVLQGPAEQRRFIDEGNAAGTGIPAATNLRDVDTQKFIEQGPSPTKLAISDDLMPTGPVDLSRVVGGQGKPITLADVVGPQIAPSTQVADATTTLQRSPDALQAALEAAGNFSEQQVRQLVSLVGPENAAEARDMMNAVSKAATPQNIGVKLAEAQKTITDAVQVAGPDATLKQALTSDAFQEKWRAENPGKSLFVGTETFVKEVVKQLDALEQSFGIGADTNLSALQSRIENAAAFAADPFGTTGKTAPSVVDAIEQAITSPDVPGFETTTPPPPLAPGLGSPDVPGEETTSPPPPLAPGLGSPDVPGMETNLPAAAAPEVSSQSHADQLADLKALEEAYSVAEQNIPVDGPLMGLEGAIRDAAAGRFQDQIAENSATAQFGESQLAQYQRAQEALSGAEWSDEPGLEDGEVAPTTAQEAIEQVINIDLPSLDRWSGQGDDPSADGSYQTPFSHNIAGAQAIGAVPRSDDSEQEDEGSWVDRIVGSLGDWPSLASNWAREERRAVDPDDIQTAGGWADLSNAIGQAGYDMPGRAASSNNWIRSNLSSDQQKGLSQIENAVVHGMPVDLAVDKYKEVQARPEREPVNNEPSTWESIGNTIPGLGAAQDLVSSAFDYFDQQDRDFGGGVPSYTKPAGSEGVSRADDFASSPLGFVTTQSDYGYSRPPGVEKAYQSYAAPVQATSPSPAATGPAPVAQQDDWWATGGAPDVDRAWDDSVTEQVSLIDFMGEEGVWGGASAVSPAQPAFGSYDGNQVPIMPPMRGPGIPQVGQLIGGFTPTVPRTSTASSTQASQSSGKPYTPDPNKTFKENAQSAGSSGSVTVRSLNPYGASRPQSQQQAERWESWNRNHGGGSNGSGLVTVGSGGTLAVSGAPSSQTARYAAGTTRTSTGGLSFR